MASLLDEYDSAKTMASRRAAAGQSGRSGSLSSTTDSLTSNLAKLRIDTDEPIFKKHKIDFTPPEILTHLVVSNNQLILAMKNKQLLRISLTHPDDPVEIDLTRYLGERAHYTKIYSLFLDPTGKHALISVMAADTQGPYENIYMSKRVQVCTKMKGHLISTVAWNFDRLKSDLKSTSSSPVASVNQKPGTGTILVGTSKGLIYETDLVPSDESKFFPIGSTTPEQFWKQAFDLGVDAGPVTGLQFHKMLSNSSDSVYFIMATTKNRLYQFVGRVANNTEPPFLYQIFNTYTHQFQDMPSDLGYSKLDLFYPSASSGKPSCFGWLTEPGVFYGKIGSVDDVSCNTVTIDAVLIPYNKSSHGEDDVSGETSVPVYKYKEKPLSMIITQFHILVLFENRLKVICTLNEKAVMEDHFTETYGKLLGIAKDPVTKTIWIYSELAVYRYKVLKEDRNIWRVYLDKEDFEMARSFAKNDPIKLDRVICEEAEYHFNAGEFKKSAALFASSQKSFEEVALKFMELENEEPLKEFLICKLDSVSGPRDTVPMMLLVTWLLDIILKQMNALRSAGKKYADDYQLLQAEFQSLLSQQKLKRCLIDAKRAVYDMIDNYGDEDNFIYFANLMNDNAKIVAHHIQNQNNKEALLILERLGRADLFYEFAPALMYAAPKELIDLLIRQGNSLDPVKLIPALIQNQELSGEKGVRRILDVIKYLEYCVYNMGTVDPVLHNYLLALYAQTQPDKLLTYLAMKGQDEDSVPYDLKFALRISLELGIQRAAIHLYATMGLYEEAVDLALKLDLDLAKSCANRPESNDDLRRRLWLKIAKHVIAEEKDIKKATEFLSECDLLKIQDILPFFPDFVTIDLFKDAICASLQEYNSHVENLKQEMKDATDSAAGIRDEIKDLRNRYAVVTSQDKCSVCNYAIMTQAFYIFGCGHSFHADCLISEVIPHLKPIRQQRVEEIRKILGSSVPIQPPSSASLGGHGLTNGTGNYDALQRDKLLNEMDEIVASECLYCGDIIIKSIDSPFLDDRPDMPINGASLDGWD